MITNLRDLGETVNILSGQSLMQEGKLFRGGSINELFDESELPPIASIINLRTGKDKRFPRLQQLHIPAADSVENYATSDHKVRYWLNQVLTALVYQSSFPTLIHCTAGKDRTGVVAALILASIGIPRSIIVQEYSLSDGTQGTSYIMMALEGIKDPQHYLYDQEIIVRLKQELCCS
jgi:protein-tyrosine phosphatase